MKISREGLLATLESVGAGLSKKEVVEQSSCYVFTQGHVCTFDGEVAARCSCELVGVRGAVSATHLTELLSRLSDDEIDIATVKGELRLKSRTGRGVVVMQSDVRLPIDQIEIPAKSTWKKLNPEFCDAVELVSACAAKSDTNYKLCCVHLTPDFVEACDNHQLARYPIVTELATKSMIRRDSLRHVIALGMTEFTETPTWLHFRNPDGLELSMRRWTDDYEDLDKLLENVGDTTPTTLPGGLAETVQRLGVFSADAGASTDVINVQIKNSTILLRGEGAGGWWEEKKAVKYTGPDVGFLISPKILLEIADRSQNCEVAAHALRVATDKFTYLTSVQLEN